MTTKQERQEAGTPAKVFETLHEEYGFTIDVCAVAHNRKLRAYLTPEDNALDASWAGERVWCNQPFDNIASFLAHANEPEFVAFLLPARTDREWWMAWKPRAECHYFLGRMAFEPPPGVRYSSNPGTNVLFLFGQGAVPGREAYRDSKTGERVCRSARVRTQEEPCADTETGG